MFTGIIEEIGTVKQIAGAILTIECNTVLDDAKLGDSIAINGCCQTVTEIGNNFFCVNVSDETFKISNFRELKTESKVNLERALILNDRIGGHIVQGHVDGTIKFVKEQKLNDSHIMYFEIPEELSKYIVKKGSVTINGVSLTVAEIIDNIMKIAVIPYTFENTTLKYLKISDKINIETDIIGRYVEKLLSVKNNKISMEFLAENGFI